MNIQEEHLKIIEDSKDHIDYNYEGIQWRVQDGVVAKEATKLTISYTIDVLKELRGIMPNNERTYQKNRDLEDKIKELQKQLL